MSFNNDDEGDGLAALFGGITPQATPADDAPGPRRAAPQQAEPTPPAAPPAAPPPIEYPAYTAPPVAPPPYSAPPSYAPPSYAPPPPAAPPYSPPPAAAPTPAPWPDAAPQYPGLAPRDEAPAPPPYSPPPPAPPFDAPPAYPAPPTFDAPAPAPAAPPAYDFPTPAAAPSRPAWEPLPPGGPPSAAPASFPPPAFPPPAFPAPAAAPLPSAEPYPGLQPPPPAYPPTAQYPTGADPFGAQPPGPALSEPPAPTGFDALGLGSGYSGTALPSGAPPTVDPAAEERDRSWSSGDAQPSAVPVVRSDAPPPATVFPPGPLLPASGDPVEAPDHLERATTGERLGLVLAVLTGPIGLIVAIVSAVRGARRRGWLIGVARASLVLGVISTIAFGFGGVALWELRVQQMQFDRLASASAEFCAAGTENPDLVTAPLLGWPAPGATISESLTLMQEWTTRWTDLAATSPEELRVGIELLAQAGTTIVDSVTQSRAVDDAANQAAISATATQSGVAEWFQTYCAVP